MDFQRIRPWGEVGHRHSGVPTNATYQTIGSLCSSLSRRIFIEYAFKSAQELQTCKNAWSATVTQYLICCTFGFEEVLPTTGSSTALALHIWPWLLSRISATNSHTSKWRIVTRCVWLWRGCATIWVIPVLVTRTVWRFERFLMLQAFTSSLKVQQVSGHMFESSLSWWGWVELFWREVKQQGRDQGTFKVCDPSSLRCMVLRMIWLVNMCGWAEHLHWFKLQKWADLSSRKLANCSFRYASTRAVWSFQFCYAQLLLLTGGSQVLDVQIYLHVFCVVWRSHNLRIPVRISGKKKVNHSRQISMFTQTHKPNGGLMFRNSMEFPDFQKTRKYGLPFIQAKWIHPWNLLNSFTLCPDFLRQLGKEKRSLSRFLTVWPYENVWQRMSSRTFGWNSTR